MNVDNSISELIHPRYVAEIVPHKVVNNTLFLGQVTKKKAKKDPNAPKKPMTAYMLWLQEVRNSIKEDNPGISVTDVSRKAGAMWKTITAVEKKVSLFYMESS